MITKKTLLQISRSVEEYYEMLAHLQQNNDQMSELQRRGVEITTQRLEVVKGLEETHSLLAEIKTRQQAMVTKERELAALEQSIMDRVRMISDDTKAILAKLSEGLEE
ncbi:hypothetical protein ACSYAY_10040 [Leptospirillum ferriphilum]|jgi:hypothetical protein|uniref:Uncharacterized protein n=4 Tax=Leptospirillum TaxID=179 RepID=A0A059XXG6_9BACT|nr:MULTISPECIES: hypothetical protein [Leptospirillum]EAY55889.1 MAG: protein of unknown function [Leptospirillum rubarum]EDZ39223.1 MAG: Protein of unknown function [Leptospirillum sp. Group II '5-way CG']EIJ76361.1 MAG: hypothetical protein C75L2_00490114 [Leptospirillum sp. Group II 'C75']AFS53739.1 hypothetical protein LFML04_1529 [Leptospirillum ferriphilum ML-04]AIA31780.1 hypothetical protein Y981_07635 [Leptospirillum ferriphilum YSK]